MIGIDESASQITTIKRGHYGLLDIHVKLRIFKELVSQALETDMLREKLDENYDELQAFAATKRGEAIKEGRERREEKERLKAKSDGKDTTVTSEIITNNSANPMEGNPAQENGNVPKKLKNGTNTLPQKGSLGSRSDFCYCMCLLEFLAP